jgi:hypothetical protein
MADNVGVKQVQVALAPRSRRGVRRNYVGNLAVPKELRKLYIFYYYI